MKPTPEQIQRGAGALSYFVVPWRLSLNPEDLEELAYAVLSHFDSDASWDEIQAAVEEQIAEHRRDREALDAIYRSRREEGPGASA